MSDFPRDFGNYTLLAELGRGGMGVVYRAEQKSLGRPVALKILSVAQDWASEETLARFRREGEVMARLAHPDVVAVHDFGVHEERVYIAMELVHGMQLDRYVQSHFPTFEQSLAIVARVARALYHAHGQGIVHRDVKPSNILVDTNGNPKLSDFGLAKVEGAKVSRSGAILGTPVYMSPEQATGEGVDARSDVYGLGAVLYEMLTGAPPYLGTSVESIVHQVVHREPVPPRVVNPKVPIDVETICLRAMEKSRDRRYATALALAEDVERWLQGEPIRARRAGPVERAWKWVRRRRLVAATVLALVLLASGGAAAAVLLSRELGRQKQEAARLRGEQERAREAQRRLEREQFRASRLITLEAEGIQLMRSDRVDEALERFREVVGEEPDLARVRLLKATCHWLLRQHDDADLEFESCLKLKADDAFVWRLRGLNRLDARKFREAVPCYRAAAQIWKVGGADLAARNEDYDILIALVEGCASGRDVLYPRPWLGDYDPGIVLQKRMEEYPVSRRWCMTFRIRTLRYLDMNDSSVVDLLDVFRDHPAVLAHLANFKRYVDTKGLPYADRCLELVPIWPKVWAWRALILKRSAASPPEIDASYGAAIELCPRYGDALYGRADWSKTCGRFEEALADFRRVLDGWDKLRWEEGDVPLIKREAVFDCARCATALGRKKEAVEFLRQAKAKWGVKVNRAELERDDELKPLRDEPEYQEFLKTLP
ncbi:MAG: protein kinase [Planctomycetes bacterium]|nr:protein kinase [Planctomycetota bacterium]